MSAVCEPWVGCMVGPFSAFGRTHPTVSWQMPGLAGCVKYGRRITGIFFFLLDHFCIPAQELAKVLGYLAAN